MDDSLLTRLVPTLSAAFPAYFPTQQLLTEPDQSRRRHLHFRHSHVGPASVGYHNCESEGNMDVKMTGE